MPGKIKDRVGKRYGMLVALRLDHVRTDNFGKSQAYWLCRCDCGREKAIFGKSLQSGNTTSCSCVWKTRPGSRTHGQSDSYTYTTWRGMKDRCYNPRHSHYKNYGERGVSVCDRWNNSFEAFVADMGERPAGKTLDRVNRNGNYEPANCRWATAKEQAANLPHAYIVPYEGSTVSLAEYARIRGVVGGTLSWRVRERGEDPIRAADELIAAGRLHRPKTATAA